MPHSEGSKTPEDAEAQFELGCQYYCGKNDVDINQEKSMRLFTLAATQGHGIAQYNLGRMYATRSGVPKNEIIAAKWYRKAADQGDPNAQYNLGVLYAQGVGVQRSNETAFR